VVAHVTAAFCYCLLRLFVSFYSKEIFLPPPRLRSRSVLDRQLTKVHRHCFTLMALWIVGFLTLSLMLVTVASVTQTREYVISPLRQRVSPILLLFNSSNATQPFPEIKQATRLMLSIVRHLLLRGCMLIYLFLTSFSRLSVL
jgi:hypothetical protein